MFDDTATPYTAARRRRMWLADGTRSPCSTFRQDEDRNELRAVRRRRLRAAADGDHRRGDRASRHRTRRGQCSPASPTTDRSWCSRAPASPAHRDRRCRPTTRSRSNGAGQRCRSSRCRRSYAWCDDGVLTWIGTDGSLHVGDAVVPRRVPLGPPGQLTQLDGRRLAGGDQSPITQVGSGIAACTASTSPGAQTTTMPMPMFSVRYSSSVVERRWPARGRAGTAAAPATSRARSRASTPCGQHPRAGSPAARRR